MMMRIWWGRFEYTEAWESAVAMPDPAGGTVVAPVSELFYRDPDGFTCESCDGHGCIECVEGAVVCGECQKEHAVMVRPNGQMDEYSVCETCRQAMIVNDVGWSRAAVKATK